MYIDNEISILKTCFLTIFSTNEERGGEMHQPPGYCQLQLYKSNCAAIAQLV